MYEKRPAIDVRSLGGGWGSWEEIAREVAGRLPGGRAVVAVECYPGVDLGEVARGLVAPLAPSLAVRADECMQDAAAIQARIADNITRDRVFGVMSHHTIDQFLDAGRLEAVRARIAAAAGTVVVYGFGASRVAPPDLLVYVDITRWEIQLRQRAGAPNWMCDNAGEDPLRKVKRGYFFEWRVADREKRRLHGGIDYLIDANVPGRPGMVTGDAYRAALALAARRPFRLVPYFDSSVWGGRWMQERFGLDPDAPNYGWAFDGVPEENGIILDFGAVRIEVPAVNLVFARPDELLGERVRARFGAEFPIRFDFLDTMGGGNLSLQVHPLVEYAQDVFGIHYTQDESYYILEATDESCVYLGVRDGADKTELMGALERAAAGEGRFPDELYVNRFPVRRHDHVSIPAGTVHCAGPGTVVLEISATPYIFTFKLWDWGRVGLDGVPRPVHLAHGAANIRMDRDTAFCERELIDRAGRPHEDLSERPGVVTERTGLHGLEFIETLRHWFRDAADLVCHGSVNMLNLVEGEGAVVESPRGAFPPMEVHFGETFIVPASCGEYRVRNTGGGRAALVQAFVRNP